MILQQLQRIQHRHGYLPRAELVALSERLGVPLYRIGELASFYPHFRLQPPPEVEVLVCRDMGCHLRGSAAQIDALKEALKGDIAAGRAAVCGVSCLGRCDRAPAVRIHGNRPNQGEGAGHRVLNYFGRGVDDVLLAARSLLAGADQPVVRPDRDADLPDESAKWKINLYAGQPRHERYQALRQFIAVLRRGAAADDERDRIIQAALKNAVLLGMGGAGGQAFKKWHEVRQAAGERKFVVCNADESEPGTFKDRELLLRTPYLVVEGVLLAAAVVGADQAYIYVRHEYEECIEAVREEIGWAREQGLVGDNVLGSGLAIELEVFVSPGGYICGEQTALIEALEDKRAEPRNRPPELQTNGLWDMPTLVNNVETLAWVPSILCRSPAATDLAGERDDSRSVGWGRPPDQAALGGAEKTFPDTQQSWYGRQGRPFGELARIILGNDADWQRRHGRELRFPGLRLFSISGDVQRPGVYEVENGITVRELIETAGGMRDGRPLLAIAFSGPSGGFTPAVLPRSVWPPKIRSILPASLGEVHLLDLQMHINYFRAWELMLGAGIVVYADGADLVAQALACQRFFQRESCGKCVPCRLGSTKLAEMAADLAKRKLSAADVARLGGEGGPIPDLAFTMASASICGLGTVAANPITTLLKYFPAEVSKYAIGAGLSDNQP